MKLIIAVLMVIILQISSNLNSNGQNLCCSNLNYRVLIQPSPFIGDWSLNSINNITFNVCPILTFDSTGLGKIIYPSGDFEKFNWLMIDSNSIIIQEYESIAGKIGKRKFSTGSYSYSFIENELFNQLILINRMSETKFVLSKNK